MGSLPDFPAPIDAIALVLAVAATVASALLLATARLPVRGATPALAWLVGFVAWLVGSGGWTGGDGDAAVRLAISGVALLLLAWNAWLWRAGALLPGARHRATTEAAPGRGGHGRWPARLPASQGVDPADLPGRYVPDLTTAHDALARGEYRSAIRDAGPVLEDVIDAWLRRDPRSRAQMEDMPMHDRINRVALLGHLTDQQRAQVGRWWGLRNRASHELSGISRAEAQEMVEGVTRLAARGSRRR
jgi:hypothetical protein